MATGDINVNGCWYRVTEDGVEINNARNRKDRQRLENRLHWAYVAGRRSVAA
jgi:hypothetical protein